MNAIVLAGGPPDAVAALAPGAANKAFVPIVGVTLVERTLRALRTCDLIDRIIVVAPRATHAHGALTLADERRDDGRRMIDSLRSGLAGLDRQRPVLVCASDLPVLTSPAIVEALDLMAERDLDIAYTCVRRDVHEARFPHVPHTWARLWDGEFCGGGVAALKPRAIEPLGRVLDSLGAARKAPWRLAGIFGPDVLARFALGRLTIADAERRASRIIGAPVGAIRCSHPEIAVNVDRPADVELAAQLVNHFANAPG